MKTETRLMVLCLTLILAGCNLAPAGGGTPPPLVLSGQDNPRAITSIPLVENAGRLPAEPQLTAPLSTIEQQWGIRIMSLRTSSAGYMLDFRFKVLDPEKAKPLLDKKNRAALIHARTGATMNVPTTPKVGALRQKATTPKAGRIYFMFFGNPGQLVKAGDEVSIVIGNFRADRLTVQ